MAVDADEQVGYWIAFGRISGVGPIRVQRLRDHFGSLAEAWRAPRGELMAAGLDSRVADAIVAARPRLSPHQEVEALARAGVQAITLDSPAYPRRLREIYSPPPVLYVRGELLPEDELALGVVGTRRATMYGREATEMLVGGLVTNCLTIVSGLARGIDTVAHRAALTAGGRTIAVLGSGLDIIYPSENARLARDIAERGAVVSEYPLGTKPDAANFPARNRIISGLSLGVLVIEAGDGSGALITADFALEQNREVFAVPGPIFARSSQGTNRLIQQGAKLVLSTNDILTELNLTSAPQQLEMRAILAETPAEAALVRVLSQEPMHIDEVCRQSGLPVAEVSSTLTMLELKGSVRHLGGMHYIRTR